MSNTHVMSSKVATRRTIVVAWIAVVSAVIAFLLPPVEAQTQFTTPVAATTANLGFNGGTTGTINTTGANLLVACVSSHATGATPQLSDSRENTWTLATSSVLFDDGEISLFYSVPTSVGSGHSFAVSGAGVHATINVMAWAGAHSAPLDQTNAFGQGSGTSIQPGSVTATQNDELLITCLTNNADSSNTSRSIDNNFTISGQVGEVGFSMAIAAAYRVQTTAAAVNPTWSYSVSSRANTVIATFKKTGGGTGGGDPSTLPRLQPGHLTLIGGFRLSQAQHGASNFGRAGGGGIDFGGGIAFNPATGGLFVTCNPQVSESGTRGSVGEIAIPSTLVDSSTLSALPTASGSNILQNCVDITEGNLNSLDGEMGNAGLMKLGSLLAHNGRVVGTSFNQYDGTNGTRVSHFAHSATFSSSSFAGWMAMWQNTKTGYVSGWMTSVPVAWQSALGGLALTGNCCLSVITRTSWGMSAFAFDPDHIVGTTTETETATPLLYYNEDHPTLGNYSGAGASASNHWNQTVQIGGMVIVPGTRTLLYFGRKGGTLCYGRGTSDPAQHETTAPDGVMLCYDPTSDGSGVHGYPYKYTFWAYDLNSLAKVKAGEDQPWQPVPYDEWEFVFPIRAASGIPGGMTIDPVTLTIYVSLFGADPAGGYVSQPIIYGLQATVP